MNRGSTIFRVKLGLLGVIGLAMVMLVGPAWAGVPGTLYWTVSGKNAAIGQNQQLYAVQGTKVVALNSTNGATIWEYDVGSAISSDLTIGPDGTIYAATQTLTAIDPNGNLKWTFDKGTLYWLTNVAVGADGAIYVGSQDFNLYAVNPVDGTKVWERLLEGIPFNPAVALDGTIYVGVANYQGTFYAINPLTGAILKSVNTLGLGDGNSSIYGCPAFDQDGIIYVGNYYSHVFAFYPNTLDVKWKATITPWCRFLASPVIAKDGTIYIGGRDNYRLFALRPTDGSQIWNFPTGYEITTAALVGSDNTVYVGSCDSKVYALDPVSGGKIWEYNAYNWVNLPLCMDKNGILYVASSYSGSLEAVFTASTGLAKSWWPMFRRDPQHTGRAAAWPNPYVTPACFLLLGE